MDLHKLATIETSCHKLIDHPHFYIRRNNPQAGAPVMITPEDFLSVKIDNCLIDAQMLYYFFRDLQVDGYWRSIADKRALDVGDLGSFSLPADLLIQMIMDNYDPESKKRLEG